MEDIRFAAKSSNLKLIISNVNLLKARYEAHHTDELKRFVQEATGSKYTFPSDENKLNGASDSDVITGWSLKDHPDVTEFSSIKPPYDELYSWDTARIILINLKGEYSDSKACQKYIEDFCGQFSPMVLSYNHYPFYVSPDGMANTSFKQFYEDLIIFSAQYRKTGIPFWNYVQCTHVKRTADHTTMYPEVNESKLRFQVFNSLAFCVQGLVFWTYGTRPSDANDIFVSSLINDEGNLTPAGEAVKRINREVQCLSDIFLEAMPVNYYTTGEKYDDPLSDTGAKIPGLHRVTLNPYYVETVGGLGTFVTTFKNKDKRDPFRMRHYLMVVSQDTENPQTATVHFKSGIPFGIGIRAYHILPDLDNENGRFLRCEIRTDCNHEYLLPAGGYLLFEYEPV